MALDRSKQHAVDGTTWVYPDQGDPYGFGLRLRQVTVKRAATRPSGGGVGAGVGWWLGVGVDAGVDLRLWARSGFGIFVCFDGAGTCNIGTEPILQTRSRRCCVAT